MARKAVLEGGKRDEIIEAAQELFLTEGFEAASVRKILNRVGGEVGMFYHYFSSKEELFDVAIDRFFQDYARDFEAMAKDIRSVASFLDVFLPSYERAMERYLRVQEKMHWTIRFALHERTLRSLIPAAGDLLLRLGYQGPYPLDVQAARAVADFSALLHAKSFEAMTEKEKRETAERLIRDLAGLSVRP